MNEYSELEFKYKANEILLKDFTALMSTLPITKQKDVSSWDHYYVNGVEDEFIRFRESSDPELTIKRKTNQANNWQRVEVDLSLDHTKIKPETVLAWVELLGYKHKRSIYKTCFIFWTEYVNFVYYIVYDNDMNEKGRFIEVEMNKSCLPKEALNVDNHLKRGQEVLAKLGLSPQNRLKKSLYELYVK